MVSNRNLFFFIVINVFFFSLFLKLIIDNFFKIVNFSILVEKNNSIINNYYAYITNIYKLENEKAVYILNKTNKNV